MKKEQIFVVASLVLLVVALLVPVVGAAFVASGPADETSVAALGSGLTASIYPDSPKCLDGGSPGRFAPKCEGWLR